LGNKSDESVSSLKETMNAFVAHSFTKGRIILGTGSKSIFNPLPFPD
jgi:hypothetical protein